jgi:RNA polymerase sigma-70 factor (ECF subfamily)
VSTEFATTSWSQVLAAQEATGTEARNALEELCETYWYPLYAYVRRRGHDPEEARDLTQGFFAELLENETLLKAEPSEGRFRSFLLVSLKHFLSHERDKAKALKRGGGTPPISLDAAAAEKRYDREPAKGLTPEEIFERRWALTVVERALGRLQEEMAEKEPPQHFGRLKSYLTGEEPRVPYREVAAELGITEGAIKVAVHRLRRRFGQLLRAEVAETLADPQETSNEVRHLLLVIRPFEAQRG